jgi:hypothetical protein
LLYLCICAALITDICVVEPALLTNKYWIESNWIVVRDDWVLVTNFACEWRDVMFERCAVWCVYSGTSGKIATCISEWEGVQEVRWYEDWILLIRNCMLGYG